MGWSNKIIAQKKNAENPYQSQTGRTWLNTWPFQLLHSKLAFILKIKNR